MISIMAPGGPIRQNDFMPFKIVRKEIVAPKTFLWEVAAPEISEAAQAGQFVMIRLQEQGERIPLTIADWDRSRGTITLVVKAIGKTTEEMSLYTEGSSFLDLVGPLGNPTRIEPLPHLALVGGGIGVAPLYPILQAFHETGTHLTTLIGFKNAGEIFWRDHFEPLSHRFLLFTEDGSAGSKGTVADGLRSLVADFPLDQVITVGPLGMMQAVAEITRPWEIPTIASMNPIMVDGIGMCGSCRVKVGGKVLFACVDGPDMDAHQVDFEELKIRQRRFLTEEQETLRRYREECRLKVAKEARR